MDSINSKGVLPQDIPKLKEESQSLLREFDKFVSEIQGDIGSDPVKNFRSYLGTYSEELNEHVRILSTVFHISSLFSSRSNLNEMLSHIVQSVREVLNFTRVIILLVNDDKSLLECKIVSGLSQDKISHAQSRPLILNKHDCIETKVARFGNTYLIEDITDSRLTEIDRKLMRNLKKGFTIYVPITSKKCIIGVLCVDRKSSIPTLKSEDIYRVQLFANYIGGLIENAKLYESIIRHKNRFENIVKQSPNGIIIADRHGHINLINQAAERLLDITFSRFLGLPVEKLIGPELFRNVNHELSKQNQVRFFDMSFESPGGKTLTLNLSALNMKYENKTEIIIIFQDITKKKIIDDHLQRLDKLASIGTMAAGMAHEIRSPLTSISMDLDSLYETAFNKEEVQKTIVLVLNEIERMDKIVSNLLQFSRPSNREFVCFDIVRIIKESFLLGRKKIGEKRIQFFTDFAPASFEITGNPDRIKQMIVNLIINAIEAIEVEGTITLKTELLKESDIYIDNVLKESFFDRYKNIIRIAIEDTGKGIPPEFKDKIFDPYFTTKSSGTGLGLSIVSKIVEEHQGYVSASSKSGSGTVFKVLIPTNLITE